MTDERLHHFSTRVLYDNWPSSLPAKEIKSIDEEIAWRLTIEDNLPRLIIDKVLDEIDHIGLIHCNFWTTDGLQTYKKMGLGQP